jgi:hypothetical protein
MRTIIITITGQTLKYNTVKDAKPKLNEIMKQYGRIGYYNAIDSRENKEVRIYDVSYELRKK